MGFLANRRMAAWTAGIRPYAVKRSKETEGSLEEWWWVGAIMAVNDATHRTRPADLDGFDEPTRAGYLECRRAIDEVLRDGVVPAEDYEELLSPPDVLLAEWRKRNR